MFERFFDGRGRHHDHFHGKRHRRDHHKCDARDRADFDARDRAVFEDSDFAGRDFDPREFAHKFAHKFDRHFGRGGHGHNGHGRGGHGRGGHGRDGHGFGHGFGRGFFGGGRGDGFGGGRERMFDAGDIKLVILKLLSEQPSHGYQLIKAMEERLGGGYTPSAGVIYPTLTLLEEEGLAASTPDGNKKVYALTAEGETYLADNKARVDELFARLEQTGQGFAKGRAPELMRAFHNLRHAAMARMARGNVTREQVEKMAEAINAAARAIDEL